MSLLFQQARTGSLASMDVLSVLIKVSMPGARPTGSRST